MLEAAKVEQKYEKQQEKRRFAQLEGTTSQETKNKCYYKKQIDHNFPWSTLLQTIEMTSKNVQNSCGTKSRKRVVSLQSLAIRV